MIGTKAEGKGKRTYETKASYTGDFKNDQANGRGVFTYPNGNVYTGEFKNDELHGKGTMVFYSENQDGLVLEGIWVEGTFSTSDLSE